MNPLNAYLAQSVLQERVARAEEHHRLHRERWVAPAPAFDAVTIRRVTPDDWQAVERLAQLEGRAAPQGSVLLAEVEDRLLAVRSLDDGATVADPFQPTGELVRLLEARARQLGGQSPRAVTRPFRRAAALVRRAA
jgi:hypothetical protein